MPSPAGAGDHVNQGQAPPALVIAASAETDWDAWCLVPDLGHQSRPVCEQAPRSPKQWKQPEGLIVPPALFRGFPHLGGHVRRSGV